jgi:P27 family predicted phage terminase small subunit
MMSDSLSKMNQIGKELGLSPKARSQLMDLKSIDNDDESIGQSLKKFFE